jgi:Peptidase M66
MAQHFSFVITFTVFIMGCEGRAVAVGGATALAPTFVQTEPDAGPVGPSTMEPGGPSIVRLSCPAALEVGQMLSCEVMGAHPANSPLVCTVDFGNGQPAFNVGDCTSVKTAGVAVAAVGTQLITLKVVDPLMKTATQSAQVTVNPKPNQKPVISIFSAAPKTGAAPLKSVLQFEVSDPDGDALTCSLDVGNDGTFEFSNFDCAMKMRTIDVTMLGVTGVKLVVSDARGLSAESLVSIETMMPRGDLSLKTIEFGQTIVSATPRLVSGKTALLKVSAVSTDAKVKAVVEVEAKRGATSLGKQTLSGPAEVPMVESPLNLSSCFQGMLPVEWVGAGVELTVTVDPGNAVVELDETNNQRVIPLTVGRGNILHLTQLAIESADGSGALIDVVPDVLKRWPFASVEVKTRAPLKIGGSFSSGPSWDNGLQALGNLRQADNSKRNYLGMVKIRQQNGPYISGIGYIGQGAALSVDFDTETVVHELGHNLGLQHAPCGGPADPDPQFPSPNGQIISTGFDGTKLIAGTVRDVMTYCMPTWVGAYNYGKVQAFVEKGTQFGPDNVALRAEVPQDSLFISGTIDAVGARIDPLMRLHTVPSVEVERSDMTLEMTTTDGRLVVVPVRLEAPSEGGAMHFATVIAHPGEIARATLRHGVDILAEHFALPWAMEPAARAERIDANHVRVMWSGGAFANVAHLRSSSAKIFIPENQEATWHTTLAMAASGGEVVVNTEELLAGQLEVSVSDGVRTQAVYLPMPE